MLTRLAGFLYARGRRVLLIAVLAAIVAGVFGFGVAKHLSPYGASDPATQSVQAMNRYQHAAGRQIDADVVPRTQVRRRPHAGRAPADQSGRARAARAARRSPSPNRL